MSRSKAIIIVLVAVAVSFSLANVAHAASITFTNTAWELTGQGFGNAPQLLTVQAQGNGTTECGGVYWNGTSDDIDGDASIGKCQTITAGSMLDQGATCDKLGLLFNINEPLSAADADLHLWQFSVDFYSPSGAEILSAVFSDADGLSLEGVDSGQGKAGWLFQINLSQAEFDQVFSDRANRIGMTIESDCAITEVGDGADDFRLGICPEPATLTVLALGLLVMFRRGRR